VRARGTVGVAFLAVLASIFLASCSATNAEPPPPAPTSAQVDQMMQDWAARQSSAYSDHILGWQRPVAFERFVAPASRTRALAACISQVSQGEFSSLSSRQNFDTTFGSDSVAKFDFASAVCSIRFPPSSLRAQLRTPAQLDYTYDYYTKELLPCLRSFGIGVKGMPSATDFREDSQHGLVAWSPYAALDVRTTLAPPLSVLQGKCPPAPPGLS
jgi:hypothetical protein